MVAFGFMHELDACKVASLIEEDAVEDRILQQEVSLLFVVLVCHLIPVFMGLQLRVTALVSLTCFAQEVTVVEVEH